MKWLILLAFAINNANAQSKIFFQLIDNKELKVNTDVACCFGGISAIELIPERVFISAEKKIERKNTLMLVSDHYPNLSDSEEQKSYSFKMDIGYRIYDSKIFYDLNNIESVRYNAVFKKFFYCYEEDDSSGVGYVEIKKNIPIKHVLFKDTNFVNNRGIEGITFTNDNSLWMAYEAGNKSSKDNMVPFYCIKPDNIKMSYDFDARIEYLYPFEKCFCLENRNSKFDGGLGNGISEILGLKDQPDKLLVLERCFDGKKANVRLYLAEKQKGSKILSKQLVFNFNEYLLPDNLEGMTWGDDENGFHILYLVSDNNYSSRQINQVIKLKMLN